MDNEPFEGSLSEAQHRGIAKKPPVGTAPGDVTQGRISGLGTITPGLGTAVDTNAQSDVQSARIGDYTISARGMANVVPNSLTDIKRRYNAISGATPMSGLKLTDAANALASAYGTYEIGAPLETDNQGATIASGFLGPIMGMNPATKALWAGAAFMNSLSQAQRRYTDEFINQQVTSQYAFDVVEDEEGNQKAVIRPDIAASAGYGSGAGVKELSDIENTSVKFENGKLKISASNIFVDSDKYAEVLQTLKGYFPNGLTEDDVNKVVNEDTGATLLDEINNFVKSEEKSFMDSFIYEAQSVKNFKRIAPEASAEALEEACDTQLIGAMERDALEGVDVVIYDSDNQKKTVGAMDYLQSVADMDTKARNDYMAELSNRITSDETSDDEKVILQAQVNTLYMASNNKDNSFLGMYQKGLLDSLADARLPIIERVGNLFGVKDLETFETNELYASAITLAGAVAHIKALKAITGVSENVIRGVLSRVGARAGIDWLANIDTFAPKNGTYQINFDATGTKAQLKELLKLGGSKMAQLGIQTAADVSYESISALTHALTDQEFDFGEELLRDIYLDTIITFGPASFVNLAEADKLEYQKVGDDVKLVKVTADEMSRRRANEIDALTDSNAILKTRELFFDQNAVISKVAVQVKANTPGDNTLYRRTLREASDIRTLANDELARFMTSSPDIASHFDDYNRLLSDVAPNPRDYTKADADYINASANKYRFEQEFKGKRGEITKIRRKYKAAIEGVSKDRAYQLNNLMTSMRAIYSDLINFYKDKGMIGEKEYERLTTGDAYKGGMYFPVWVKDRKYSVDSEFVPQTRNVKKEVIDPEDLIDVERFEDPLVTFSRYIDGIMRNVAANERKIAIREAASLAGMRTRVAKDTGGALKETENLKKYSEAFQKTYHRIVSDVEKEVPTFEEYQKDNAEAIKRSSANKDIQTLDKLQKEGRDLRNRLRREIYALDRLKAESAAADYETDEFGVKVKNVDLGGNRSAKIDYEIADRIAAMNRDGLKTLNSHSGIGADHAKESDAGGGYIQFSPDISREDRERVKAAAEKANMSLVAPYNLFYNGVTPTVYQDNMKDGTSRDDLHREANAKTVRHFRLPLGSLSIDPIYEGENQAEKSWVTLLDEQGKLNEGLEYRDARFKELVEKHGGYALDTDAKRSKAWDIFFKELGYSSEMKPPRPEKRAPEKAQKGGLEGATFENDAIDNAQSSAVTIRNNGGKTYTDYGVGVYDGRYFETENPKTLYENSVKTSEQEEALGYYTAYNQLNSYLRNPESVEPEVREWLDKKVKALDSAIGGELSQNTVVYRAMGGDLYKTIGESPVFDNLGYTSTTLNPEVVSDSLGDMVRLTVDAGTKALYIGDNTANIGIGKMKDEQEILFPRNMTVVITRDYSKLTPEQRDELGLPDKVKYDGILIPKSKAEKYRQDREQAPVERAQEDIDQTRFEIAMNKAAQAEAITLLPQHVRKLMKRQQDKNTWAPVKLDIESYVSVNLANGIKAALRENNSLGALQVVINKAVTSANPYIPREDVINSRASAAAERFRKRETRNGWKDGDTLLDDATNRVLERFGVAPRVYDKDRATISYMLSGKREKMTIEGPGAALLAEELNAPDFSTPKTVAGKALEKARKVGTSFARTKRTLTSMIDPTSAIRNMWRDMTRGTVTTGGQILLPIDDLRKDAIEDGNYTPEQVEKINRGWELAREAISRSTFTQSLAVPKKNRPKAMILSAKSASAGNAFERFYWDFKNKSVVEKASMLNDAAETFTRNRAMDVAYYRTLKKSTSEGKSIDEAIKDATEAAYFYGREATTNFSRRGAYIRKIAEQVPYLSQRFASLESFTYAYLDNPIAVSRSLKATVTSYAALITIALSNDESRKRYFMLSEYDRASNIIIPLDNGLIVTIPLDDNVAAFLTPYRRMIETLNGVDPEAFYLWGADFLAALSPLDLEGFSEGDKFNVMRGFQKLGNEFIPTWALPILENMQGYDFYYGTKIRVDEDYTESYYGKPNPTPAEMTTKGKNSKILGEIANATGIPQWKLQNLYETYGGNVGQYTLNVIDKLAGATEEAQGGKEFFDSIFKPFTGSDSNEAQNAMWDGIEQLNREKKTLQREVKDLNMKIDASTGDEKAKLMEQKQKKIKEYGLRVSDFLNQYLSAFEITGGLSKSDANRIWYLYDIYGDPENAKMYQGDSYEDYYNTKIRKQRNKHATNLAAESGFDKYVNSALGSYYDTYGKQALENSIYGQGLGVMGKIADALEDTSNYEQSFSKLRSDAYEARKKAYAANDYDLADAIAYEYDYQILSAALPYLQEGGLEQSLDNSSVMDYLKEWVIVPSEEMTTANGRYLSRLPNEAEKGEAFKKRFIKKMYGVLKDGE